MFTCHEHMRDMFHSLGADVRILPQHLDVVEHGAKPESYESFRPVEYEPIGQPIQQEPAREPMPIAVEPRTIPVEYVHYASSNVRIDPDDYDAELEYELSAVTTDQRTENLLRNELVYISPNLPGPLDLSGDEDIWRENSRNIMR